MVPILQGGVACGTCRPSPFCGSFVEVPNIELIEQTPKRLATRGVGVDTALRAGQERPNARLNTVTPEQRARILHWLFLEFPIVAR